MDQEDKFFEEILDKLVKQDAESTRIGSGDDQYFVDQVHDYVNKQKKFWVNIIKQTYNLGVEAGRIQVMDEHGILYGEDARKFMDDMLHPKPLTEDQKKLWKEIEEVGKQENISLESLETKTHCSACGKTINISKGWVLCGDCL